jgi:putative peptide zinc metalloprotease protein
MTPVNLVLLLLIYPVVKLLHEMAHAYAAKLHGGEVHEIGIMFLVFMPVPFVDASAATAFRERRMRMLVGAAGIMVELLLAVLALFLWLLIEPGIVSRICFNIMLIGGISTLLFNGNPLLRFDGYYVLADAIGIPNLAQRANKYLAYLVQYYLLGLEAARSPASGRGEAPWLVFYGVASFCYRLVITAVICLFLIDTLFIVGILLAIWAVYNQLFLPLLKQLRFVLFDPTLRRHRSRAVLVTGGSLLLLFGLVMWLPVSSLTRFEGVIWPPDEAQLVAETEGFVEQLLAQPGVNVALGQPLIQLGNTRHRGEMAVKQARMRELSARFRAARVSDRVQAKLVQDEIAALRGEIARLQGKIDALVITSPARGIFVLPLAEDLPGQHVHQGKLLGYVIDDGMAVARVVVTQEDQDRIRQRLDAVELRLASGMDTVLQGRLLRAVPQASHQLPSKVLSVEGGGPFTPDPSGITDLSTRERLFEYEVELPLPVAQAMIGSRVYVRFDHGRETLWTQLSRRFRQLFLRRLND